MHGWGGVWGGERGWSVDGRLGGEGARIGVSGWWPSLEAKKKRERSRVALWPIERFSKQVDRQT